MKAESLIERVRQRYASASRYSDQGAAVLTVGSDEMRIAFETSFERPERFSFAFTAESSASVGLPDKYSYRIDCDGALVRMEGGFPPLADRPDSIGLAIASLTGVSFGCAHTIPRLLMPDVVDGRELFGFGSIRDVVEAAARGPYRDVFRIVEYSVQADHVHLVVEAESKRALSSGMRRFATRVALRINGVLGRRRGRVWADRYHRRDLPSPREVRHALVYVINNHLKHYPTEEVPVVDPCSSAPWFTGWMHIEKRATDPPPVAPASTWLLREGWHRFGGGFIHLGETTRGTPHTQVTATVGYGAPASRQ
jgi:REP element-mobilizing transposase RayT